MGDSSSRAKAFLAASSFTQLRPDELAHHGVLGMKWGVRKDDGPSERDLAVRKAAGANSKTSDKYREMYGPETSSHEGLTDKQKKILLGVGIGVGVGLLAVGSVLAYKYINKDGVNQLVDVGKDYLGKLDPPSLPPTKFQEFITDSTNKKFEQSVGYTKEAWEKLSSDGVKLDAGSILKRVSTVKETEIGVNGFFAAANDVDVNRYKAVLPTYWKQWGYNASEGFVVNLKAKAEVKAPSPKDTVNIFKSLFDSSVEQETIDWNTLGTKKIQVNVRQLLTDHLKLITSETANTDDDIARLVFPNFAMGWVKGAEDNNPLVASFFAKVKEQGYNALIDMNDAGSLGDQPLRVLDGSLFEIAGHDILSKEAISAAQDAILALAHMFEEFELVLIHSGGGEMTDLSKAIAFINTLPIVQMEPDELAHYGVLGMKWGRHLPGRVQKSHNPKQPRKIRIDGSKRKYSPSSSSDHVQSRELLTNKKHQLSNSDIDKIVSRLQKEKKLTELNPSKVQRGKKITLGVIAAAGTAAGVYNLATSPAGKAAVSRGKKVVDVILKKAA